VRPRASAAASSAPLPSASGAATATKADAAVRLAESVVFTFRVPGGGRSPEERARRANKALSDALADPNVSEIRVRREGDAAVVYAGSTPIAQFFEDDARAAGDSSLDVHASAAAAAVRRAIASERERSRIAKNVFSGSLVVFFALIAFYLLRKFGEVLNRVRAWLEANGDRVLAIRVQRIEIVTPAVLKSTALIAVGLAKWIGQFGILYAWLVIVLSLFEATRGYTQRLTGFVVTPFSQLMERIATALPLLVVATIAALAVFVLVRFVGLFFAGVARRETALAWLPPDLAAPTSVLLRVAIVVAALVFAAPIVTGDPNGALARAGAIALIAVGLAGTPLLATGLVGSVVLFGRRLRVGEHVEFAGSLGRISAINLFELRLETRDRSELRIPHLMLLRSPLRGLGLRPRIGVELSVSATAAPSAVLRLLDEAAAKVGFDVTVELERIDVDGLLYIVSAVCPALDSRSKLTLALLEALASAEIPLGRNAARRE
jgi:small-conductance mechanosensitive channel